MVAPRKTSGARRRTQAEACGYSGAPWSRAPRGAWGLALFAFAAAAAPAQLANAVFEVREQAALEGAFRGVPFLAGDEFNLGAGGVALKPSVHAGTKGNVRAINVLATGSGDVRWRREVALHPDGSLEVTARMQVLPWQETPGRVVTWSLKVSAKALDGARYRALVAKTSAAPPQAQEGRVSAAGPDAVLASQCRYVAFSGERLKCTFDLDPYGVLAMQHFTKYGGPIGSWTVRKQGEHVVFSFAGNARFCGGVYTGKLRVWEGERAYRDLHPYEEWSYVGATPAQAQYSFGTPAGHLRGFTKADALPFADDKGWGWEKAEGLEVVSPEPADVAANCVAGASPAAFKFRVPRPGHYVVTVRAGHAKLDLGPFGVGLNGRSAAAGVRVKAGETRTLPLAAVAEGASPSISVGFSGGPWAVRTVVVQPLAYENEDFSIARGMWVVDTLDPLDLAWPAPQP
jgi:hypothetical protein